MTPRYPADQPWPTTSRAAIDLQERLRHLVIPEDDFGVLSTVAGVDVGYAEGGKLCRAAVVLLSFPGLVLVDHVEACLPTSFPYVPGLLAFREVPSILAALNRLERRPGLLLCDGHGLAHPRRFGLACHLGILTGLPAIGVAKRQLIGEHEPLGNRRGDWQPLRDGQEVIGAVLRTRDGVRPVYVSTGHRVSLATAVDLVLACAPRFRLPQPIRLAHGLATRPLRAEWA
jgi:deoxyribonuclease V